MKPKSQTTVGAVKKRVAAFLVAIALGNFPLLAANPATQLAFTAQPPSTVVGAAITNVVVQLKDKTGTNATQSGVVISLALNKGGGLAGVTNATTDATGKAAFTNLKISTAINGISLVASATGLKSATSSAFNISKGSTAASLVASTNALIYGQNITLTATVSAAAPASGLATGTVTFKDGATILGTAALNASGIATFSTNRISAVTASHTLTAVYAGDTNFLASTSGSFSLSAGKLALTVSGVIANNKIYDGTTTTTLNFSNAVLNAALAGDTVTLNSAAAKGTFASKTVGTSKTVTVTGLALAGVSAGNYSVTPPAPTANITPRSLAVTAKGANKIYDATTKAVVTLADNRLVGDVFTNGYATATFASKNVGTAILINVSGLVIGGTDAGNYALSNLTATATANITPAGLTVSGIIASNKIYDATTTATLNYSSALLVTVFTGDVVTLNSATAKGVFANKNVGAGKTVQVSGLTLAGTNAGNYSLTTQPVTTASITPRSLTITAKGVNKIYNAATNATVTLADNRVAGDVLTDSYASASFTNKNVGTTILINVIGLAIAGTDSTNYVLFATSATATANITAFPLTVSGTLANNKTYDATRTATLNFSNAALVTVFSGDIVTLNTSTALATFANKNVGTNKAVTISGLALAGANAGNYTFTQPAATANITPRSLSITATGVNKAYNGNTNATVTLADNRIAGDLLNDSYAAAGFISPSVGTNLLVNVYGLAIAGTDVGNYNLAATSTATTANILPATLVVTAANLSRPYATTNPVLSWVCSGFVAAESLTNSDVTGAPALTTTAKTNSVVGTYAITIAKGTLASLNYKFTFANGVLTVTKADTAALLTTTINPARTNQNVTFAATINPLARTVLPPTGVIQFKCNGTNKLGNAVSLNNSAANLTVIAANLGQNNAVITAEYSDPAGNFNPSTNSLTQTILSAVAVPPAPCKLCLTPDFHCGNMAAQISGESGQTYIIEASADLIHWSPLSTNVADTNGIVSLIDSNAVAFPSRFYRAYTP